MDGSIEPLAGAHRYHTHVDEVELLAENVSNLGADSSILVEQHIAKGFNFFIRTALMLTVQRSVEEGHLNLVHVAHWVNLTNLNIVCIGVAKYHGQPFDEPSLGLGGTELLQRGIQRKLEQDTVITFVVGLVDYHNQSIGSRQTFTVFGNLRGK